MNKITAPLLLAASVLSGCAAVDQPQQPQVNIVPADTSVQYEPGELNSESVYALISAELAGQQQNFPLALDLYLDQARKNNDAALAERATRIAQYLRKRDKVLEAASLWHQAEPDNVEPQLIVANILLQEGKFAEAMPLLDQIMTVDSNQAVLLIASQADQMPPQVAAQIESRLQDYAKQTPRRLDIILARSVLLRRSGQEDAALTLLDQGLKYSPLQPDLVWQKADLIRAEQPKAALRLVQRSLRRNPDNKPLQILSTRLTIELTPNKAEKSVNALLDNYPQDMQLKYYFALYMLEHNQPDLSRTLLEELQQDTPENSTLQYYLGLASQEQGDTSAAIAFYEKVQDGPNLTKAYAQILTLLDSPDDASKVNALMIRARHQHPDVAPLLATMQAQWLSNQGYSDEAQSVLDSALQQHPDDIQLLYSKALSIEATDPQQMLDKLERALALSPNNPMIQNALGYSLTVYGTDYQRAYDLISAAMAQTPNDPAVLDSMGWVLHKLDRNKEAIPYLTRAYAIIQDPEIVAHLVTVLWYSGDKEHAVALVKKHQADIDTHEELKKAAALIGVSAP